LWGIGEGAMRETTNGEKRILRHAVGAAFALGLAVNAWAIKDYLAFKQVHQQAEAATVERLKWQEAALTAIAAKLGIAIPPPPQR